MKDINFGEYNGKPCVVTLKNPNESNVVGYIFMVTSGYIYVGPDKSWDEYEAYIVSKDDIEEIKEIEI